MTRKVRDLVLRYPSTTWFLFYISVIVTLSLVFDVISDG